jgi:hypothetical protein
MSPSYAEQETIWEEMEKQYERRIKADAEIWKAKWPNACPKCLGSGGHSSFQRHPYGSTYATEELFDICECREEDRCPRCSAAMPMEQDAKEVQEGSEPAAVCSACGWREDKPDFCPRID